MGRAPPNAPQKEENGRKKQIEFNGGRELRNLIHEILFAFLFFSLGGLWAAGRQWLRQKERTKRESKGMNE